MVAFQRVNSYLLFAFNGLLVMLAVFQSQVQVPPVVAAVGRLHPLLVHLPIGFFVLTSLLFLVEANQQAATSRISFLLHLTALVAVVTACAGVLLSAEGGYDPTTLNRHLVSGTLVSVASAALAFASTFKHTLVFRLALAATMVILILAGHLGGVLTHGEDYLWQPLNNSPPSSPAITDSSSFYQAAIYPIFQSKCVSCHNEKKAKGGLVLTRLERALAGGKHGTIWKPGNSTESVLVQRILLPLDAEEHMPPSGKPQLSDREVRLLQLWIDRGADTQVAWTRLKPTDSLRLLAAIRLQASDSAPRYEFEFASNEAVAELNTPYLTVQPLAADLPALKADFFLSGEFQPSMLEKLIAVQDQLVSLNLSNMPIADQDLKLISQFPNLEKVMLNNTGVGKQLPTTFRELKKLRSLALSGTQANLAFLKQVAELPALREVFLWNTPVTTEEVRELAQAFPAVSWQAGFQPSETLTLTPPLLVNESFVVSSDHPVLFRHNIKGARIRYTTDASEPDSVQSLEYKMPIPVNGYTIIKARACRAGWYCSSVNTYYFFQAGQRPDTASLLQAPDKSYRGGGAAILYDSEKGTADSFRDKSWIGYRQDPLVAQFEFEKPQPVREVVLSVGLNMGAYLLLPQQVEVWAGSSPAQLKKLASIKPTAYTDWQYVRVEGVRVPLGGSVFPFYKIVAVPCPRVPEFISKKPEKGWLFVDEVFFN